MKTLSEFASTGLFTSRVPRYTSYPTAPHFSSEVGPSQFKDWIGDIKPGSEVSLYLHIPFCPRLCWFCACRTQGVQSAAPVDNYLETLSAEIAAVAKELPKDVRVSHLHWGGGSPTILNPDKIAYLAGEVADKFERAEKFEFSVEIDPCSIDDAKIEALVAAGLNRASLGVQDFDEKVQQAIGRLQSFEQTKATIDALRAAGVPSLNLDMVYGLPYQDTASLTETVEKVIALQPDRLALYGYAHVPWMAKRQKLIPEESLPSPEERFGLFELASEKFQDAGLMPVGIDHFAKAQDSMAKAVANGTLRRNFQGYTTDTSPTLIGLGASSISRFEQGYAQNISGTAQYQTKISGGELATARGYAMRLIDQIRAAAIESLMCSMEIDLDDLRARFGDFADILAPELRSAHQQYADDTEFDGTVFRLHQEALPLTRLIASRFDSFLTGNDNHSAAI